MAGVVVEAKRHNNMSHIKSKDTMPEIMFCKALWHCGIRYRKNYKKLPGTPDIAITKRKIAILWMAIFGMHGIIRISRESKSKQTGDIGFQSYQEM